MDQIRAKKKQKAAESEVEAAAANTSTNDSWCLSSRLGWSKTREKARVWWCRSPGYYGNIHVVTDLVRRNRTEPRACFRFNFVKYFMQGYNRSFVFWLAWEDQNLTVRFAEFRLYCKTKWKERKIWSLIIKFLVLELAMVYQIFLNFLIVFVLCNHCR